MFSRVLQVFQAPMEQVENLDLGEALGPQDLRGHREQPESQWVGTYIKLMI